MSTGRALEVVDVRHPKQVQPDDAFHGLEGLKHLPTAIMPGIWDPAVADQIWGAPTSRPAPDPANGNFIYQRFQRGIMHYDKGCGCTQGLLLADYVKALVAGCVSLGARLRPGCPAVGLVCGDQVIERHRGRAASRVLCS